jgi:hypothetical protein
MVLTRPDIAFVQSRMATYLSDPASHHSHVLKNVVRYLRSTIKQKIRYGPGGAHEHELECIRTQTGLVTQPTGRALQGESVCSTEDPFRGDQGNSLALQLLAQSPTVQMYGDNQGALALVKNPQLQERSKHIDIRYHFIRNLAEHKKLQIEYIPTTDMIADGFTKPLQRVAFEKFKKQLGLVDEGL